MNATPLRFGAFELHEEHRRLLCRGKDVPMQKRVFDLLVYLTHHHSRVVSKDELVKAVWDGAFVADGAVQRAVSLARSTLREGGIDDAIRTYPRQGYRFCYEDLCDVPEPDLDPRLASARTAFEEWRWQDAIDAWAESDAAGCIEAQDLESWGEAAVHLGRPQDAFEPLERAVSAHAADDDSRRAAGAAIALANLHLEGRDVAVAQGWHRRAQRYLRDVESCRETALLDWIEARIELFHGDLRNSLALSEKVHRQGRDQGDPDLEAFGLLYRGFALVTLGEIERGSALENEAGALVLAEAVAPWVGSIVFCGIIFSCLSCGEYARAAEWNEQFDRWCRDRPLNGYSGVCRLHRAELMTLQGELSAAEHELEELRHQLGRSAPWAEGDVYRVLGDVRLAQGDLEGAEKAFHRAHELGWDPHPGYALLQLARGRREAALRGLEQALESGHWTSGQRRGMLLAHLAQAAAAVGKTERARGALQELEDRPELWTSSAARARVERARAELALAEDRATDAVRHLRTAIQRWRDVPSPCNMATERLRLAEVMASQDADSAALELAAAESFFEKMGLPTQLEECRSLRRSLGA